MLRAALWSRSCTVAHLGQVHSRIFSGMSSMTCPQAEQVLLDGAPLSIINQYVENQRRPA
jgi:hypothetical protein